LFWYQSGKYMRVRAYLETDDMTEFLPVLSSISVTYSQRPGDFPPTVTVTSPNGGEDWMKTKVYPVTWTATGNLNDTSVSLAYSTNNGTSWTDIATRKPNTGHYQWTVVNTETSGALIRVTITDIDGRQAIDTSDATFAIDPPAPKAGQFHYPAGGDVMSPGPVSISWTVEDPWGLAESPLTLELTTDGGITWTTIADRLPFIDGFSWEAPDLDVSSDRCRMRLSVLSWLGDVSFIESGDFSIDVSPPSVVLLVPDAFHIDIEAVVHATTVDDLAIKDVVIHVSNGQDERTYEMVEGPDGTWTFTYVPIEGDELMWLTATDGVHTVESEYSELSLERADGSSGSGASALIGELVIAAAIGVMVAIAGVLFIRRRGDR
jgi:hypothetical protein